MSYGSELSNRGPTFDMDISDFMDGDQPISYEKAKGYFARDPSQRYFFIFFYKLYIYFHIKNYKKKIQLYRHEHVLFFRWAAYVAGTILVLMKELNIRFDSSISMLVIIYLISKYFLTHVTCQL